MTVWEPADLLNSVIVCRGDPVAQVMGPCARRLRATRSALYRVTFSALPTVRRDDDAVAPTPHAFPDDVDHVRPTGRTGRSHWLPSGNVIIFHYHANNKTKNDNNNMKKKNQMPDSLLRRASHRLRVHENSNETRMHVYARFTTSNCIAR